MKTWTSALALTITGALLVGPAFAQSPGTSSGGDGTKQPGMQQPGTTPGGTGAPTTGTGTTDAKPGAAQSDAAKGAAKGQAAAGNKQQLRAVQEVLKERGMYEGEVDGIMGPKTQAALREFQKKEGLQETGRLDQQTMARLGVDKTGATGGTSPAASPSSGAPKDKPGAGAPQQKDQPATPGTSGSSGAAKDDAKPGDTKK